MNPLTNYRFLFNTLQTSPSGNTVAVHSFPKREVRMNKHYILYETSSHAWLQVPTKDLEVLKIKNEISNCSFQLGNLTYLEEDLDLPLFFNTAKGIGWKVQITDEIHINDVSILRELL